MMKSIFGVAVAPLVLPNIAEVGATLLRGSGPSPSTNARQSTVEPGTASASPSATGRIPGNPGAGAEQESNAPAQSAKLMIIAGVGPPKAAGAGNSPCAPVGRLVPVDAPAEPARAAYSTLHGPDAIDSTSPNSVFVPE